MVDISRDGQFRQPSSMPMMARLTGLAIVVAVVAGALGIAALALWFALAIIPVAIIAGAFAWIAFRFQLWRARGTRRDLRTPPYG